MYELSVNRVLRLSWLLTATAMILVTSACIRSEPVLVDHDALVESTKLELRTGERMTIAGYTSDAVAVEDDDVLRIVAEYIKTTTP